MIVFKKSLENNKGSEWVVLPIFFSETPEQACLPLLILPNLQ